MSSEVLCELLADKRRRTILRCLLDHHAPIQVHELADECLSALEGVPSDSEESRDRLLTSIHHVHLPKLADAGVIEYWFELGLVHPQPGISEVEPLLQVTEPRERSVKSRE